MALIARKEKCTVTTKQVAAAAPVPVEDLDEWIYDRLEEMSGCHGTRDRSNFLQQRRTVTNLAHQLEQERAKLEEMMRPLRKVEAFILDGMNSGELVPATKKTAARKPAKKTKATKTKATKKKKAQPTRQKADLDLPMSELAGDDREASPAKNGAAKPARKAKRKGVAAKR